MMDYRQLRSFIVLAEQLHFGRAAQALNIAQPALSQHIKHLEKELGLTLFVRDRRHVELTSDGKQLLPNARQAVSHFEQFKTTAHNLRQGFKGTLQIGYVGSSILDPAFTWLINRYLQHDSGVHIAIAEHDVNEQLTRLADAQLDVGIVRSPVPEQADFAGLTIATRDMVAVLPQHHRLATQPHIALRALANECFFIQQDPPGVGLGWSSLAACQHAGFRPHNIQFTRDVSVAMSQVAMGMGVTLVPATQATTKMPGVHFCQLDDVDATTSLMMLWKRTTANRAVHHFVAYAKAQLRSATD